MHENQALIIEDTPANRDFFDRLIQQSGFSTHPVATGAAALAVAAELKSLQLALIDMHMPDVSGLDLTYHLRNAFPEACLIIATMYDERSLMESAFLKGCNIYMVKPYGFVELFKRLTTAGCTALIEASPMVIDQHGPRPFDLTGSGTPS